MSDNHQNFKTVININGIRDSWHQHNSNMKKSIYIYVISVSFRRAYFCSGLSAFTVQGNTKFC